MSRKFANFFRPTREVTAEARDVSLASVKRICAARKKIYTDTHSLPDSSHQGRLTNE